jgi:hypothetical protein
LNIIGFFALIYGWFIMDDSGISLEGIIAVVAGLTFMLHKEIFAYLKGRHYGK